MAYEVEIKSLLGSEMAAEALREKMMLQYPDCKRVSQNTQKNHYFEGGDPQKLSEKLSSHLSPEDANEMDRIARDGKKISLRTRLVTEEGKDALPRIVMKASIGDDSSSNGVARAELDAPVSGLSFDELDAEVLAAGYTYQAKWSRAREEYKAEDLSVCLDKNAGYGYLAEFEKVINDASEADATKAALLSVMAELGAEELSQERLERMFAFYNANWPEYYGTDKIFVIE
jgi:adenylate cyclase class IV